MKTHQQRFIASLLIAVHLTLAFVTGALYFISRVVYLYYNK